MAKAIKAIACNATFFYLIHPAQLLRLCFFIVRIFYFYLYR